MSDSTPKDRPVSLRRLIQPVLTTLSHGSTPFISTFIFIHLAAPVMANLGGTSLSTQVMLLGREYYQTSFGEKFLVLTPLLVHPIASCAKRILAPVPARRLTSVLSVTGYAATIFVALHYFTHRVLPADPTPPILAIGPAQLDYEFVKFALQEWPWRSWLAYVGLTTVVAWHAAEGMNVEWKTYFRNVRIGWKSTAQTRAIGAIAIVLPVASGLFFMAKEPLMALTSQVAQFRGVLAKSPLYQF